MLEQRAVLLQGACRARAGRYDEPSRLQATRSALGAIAAVGSSWRKVRRSTIGTSSVGRSAVSSCARTAIRRASCLLRRWGVTAACSTDRRPTGSRGGRGYDGPREHDLRPRPRRASPARGLPGLRGALRRQAGRVPRLRLVGPEAAPGARPDARLLRARVRERPSRRLPARRAGDGGLRGGAPEGRRVPQRAEREGGDLHPQRDRGASTSSRTRGASTTSAPGTSSSITELEHHANFVPWQYIASRTGASFRHIPIDDPGELQLDALDGLAREGNVKVVANNLVSNSLGTINPVERARRVGARAGAIMVVDAAQAAPHRTVDVQALGCDFVAISVHKICGPSGIGALWGAAGAARGDGPFNLGGEMIRSVGLERTTFNELPYKFEAGTPAIAEAVGFGAAIDYVTEIGLEAIEAHEHELPSTRWRARRDPWVRRLRPARRAARRDRLVRRRGDPPARRRADPRLGGGRRPRRAPLHAAADDAPRRRRDDARELLPLLDPRGDRPPRGGLHKVKSLGWDERVRAAVPRGDPRPLQARGTTALLDPPTRSPRGRTRSAATR